MSRKKHNSITHIVIKNAPLLLIIAGAFLVLLSGTHWYLRYKALSFDSQLVGQYQQTNNDTDELLPTHIFIQWFIDTPISEQIFENNTWTISETEASYLAQSAKPGENGNIIIYGHNTRKILGNIRALTGNETITLTTKNGSTYQYKITLIKEVDPDQTEYLLPTTEETLTLYTCSSFMDKKRFIVQAKPFILEELDTPKLAQ